MFVVFSIATEPVLRYLTRFVEWIREGYIRLFKNPEKKRV